MPTFPASGGNSPGLAPFVQYISGSGNDNNDGSSWQLAKKSTGSALAQISGHLGGELHIADGATGNIWIRGDGVTIPGWISTNIALRVIGHGRGRQIFPYGPAALLTCGSASNRTTPAIWIVGCIAAPIAIENIIPTGGIVNNFIRTWDYKRYANASVAWSNITSWHRTAGYVSASSPGSATLTIELPTARAIDNAARTSNVTRIYITAPAAPQLLDVSDHSGNGQWIKLNMTASGFNSGEFRVIAGSLANSGGNNWYFDVADPGVDKSITPTPGTYQSSQICVNDRIEVQSTEPNVPTTAYYVTAVTDATHIVVRDPYGYSPRSATGTWSNPGQYVYQARENGLGLFRVSGCNALASSATADAFINGPTIDIANTSDGRIYFDHNTFGGMSDPIVDCRDKDRACWLLADPGSKGVAGLTVRESRPAAGGIRIYGSTIAGWGIDASDIQGDNAIGFTGAPALETINGNSNGVVLANNVTVVDQDITVPNVILDAGMANGYTDIRNCGLVTGPGFVQGGNIQNAWSERAVNPESQSQWGFWAFNRLAARVPSQWRTVPGLASSRYLNKVLASDSWTLGGGQSLTTGQPDPIGGTGAVRINAAGDTTVYNVNQSIAQGDTWVFGCWVKQSGGLVGGNSGFVILIGGDLLAPQSVQFKGDGEWQWLFCYETVSVPTFTGDVTVQIRTSGDLTVYEPTLLKIPVGDMTTNEIAEYCTYLRSQPKHLPAGMDGNGVGRKFIAHAGFGTNSANAKTVGVGSGQLTLTGSGTVYLPMYDLNGTTIIGWVAQLQASVNP